MSADPPLLEITRDDAWTMIVATLAGNGAELRITSSGQMDITGNTAQLCMFLLEVASRNSFLAMILAERVGITGMGFTFRHVFFTPEAQTIVSKEKR